MAVRGTVASYLATRITGFSERFGLDSEVANQIFFCALVQVIRNSIPRAGVASEYQAIDVSPSTPEGIIKIRP